MAEKIIEVKKVSKRYDNKTVLNNISFSVRKGTIHGFIGPNGAGKTTTLSILTRLVLPTHGETYIDNKSVSRDPSFNRRLGFIPAEPRFPSLTVENYLLDCGYLRDIPKGEVLRKLAIFTLSLYRPKIYLLDEPFNGLDPSFRQDLFNNLKSIRDKGGTILMSTHILSDLQKLADDITMIKGGKIVYTGTKTADIEKTYEDYFIERVSDEVERRQLEQETKYTEDQKRELLNLNDEILNNEYTFKGTINKSYQGALIGDEESAK
ncbi:12950_t:CDS:2 [Ambispora gerdemannii]|uniref:12950_t:CDS:1 n=1 Tax=Ambispora gerdemannii TaxID=144530 RepID=A0A9N8VMU8_9GLOM|nr:12950_t:CDS:2 [Ambispora gerdemannii]